VVSLQLGAVAGLAAELSASLGEINAKLSAAAAIALTLGTPGIEAYSYEGTAGQFTAEMGPEFNSGLRIGGGPNLPIHAVVFVATDSGALQAMGKVFPI